MYSPIIDKVRSVALAPGLSCLVCSLSAQVTEWDFVKAPIYQQTAANTMPTTPWQWEVGVDVTTTAAADAGLITLTGGNLSGSVSLEQDGTYWSLSRGYATQAAMNAEFPSNASYTLTMSGGTLGVLTQSFTVGAEQYPNTPYLTGSSFNTIQQFPSATATTLTWNQPGPLVQASGFTGLGIEDRSGNEVFSNLAPGAVTSMTVPANSLHANDCHWGWLAFWSAASVPAGGFGAGGLIGHGRATDLELRTWPFPTAACAWNESHGSGCVGLELQSSDPILGSSWDLMTFGIAAPTPLAFTYFSFGPQNPPLPLSAFGLNAPGCTSYIDAAMIVANLGGIAQNGQLNVSIPVPAAQSFGGILFYVQTVALTATGIGTSNMVEAMFGN